MFAFMVIVMVVFIGLAIDLSRLYNRKVELQTAADTAALAAARQLAGTDSGIDAAVAAAGAIASKARFDYGHQAISWSPAAIKFSTAPSGSAWLDVSAARSAPAGIAFVKVDTADIGGDIGVINTFFMRIKSDDMATATTSASAVAGRSSIRVTPIGVCALSDKPASYRIVTGDLLQYGFRRGVGYDLMQLNPKGANAENFVINPIDPAGSTGSNSNMTPGIVGPFVCAGNIPMGTINGSQVKVSRPFPLSALYPHLNSRFDQFSGGACNFRSAPPDVNIKPYTYNTSAGWMKSAAPSQQGAKSTNGNPLLTIADLADDSGNTAPMYGVMWSYARPVPYSAYVVGMPEPAAGYLPFPLAAWAPLYGPGKPEPKTSYPTATPYGASGGANFTSPSSAHGMGLKHRRVLNVALLDCPVAGGVNAQATVLAVGKFFMTVPATATTINTEFAGIASDDALSGSVELYQ
jgi:hypothetical protein